MCVVGRNVSWQSRHQNAWQSSRPRKTLPLIRFRGDVDEWISIRTIRPSWTVSTNGGEQKGGTRVARRSTFELSGPEDRPLEPRRKD
jgi:hypothetical protein